MTYHLFEGWLCLIVKRKKDISPIGKFCQQNLTDFLVGALDYPIFTGWLKKLQGFFNDSIGVFITFLKVDSYLKADEWVPKQWQSGKGYKLCPFKHSYSVYRDAPPPRMPVGGKGSAGDPRV